MIEIPKEFLDRYVRKAFRERFSHEWKSKPGRLNSRICHFSDELFKPEFKHDQYDYSKICFKDDEGVLILGSAYVDKIKYCEAKVFLGRGIGVLIISIDGTKFIAETESMKGQPYKTYVGC